MTVNRSRSQNVDLLEGATDGRYRKIRPDTVPLARNSAETMHNREHLHPPMNYDFITQQTPPEERSVPGT